MKKKISVLALSSILITGSAWAAAYRIPEQSVDSVAKAGANIASSMGADASYYNPANMSWVKKDAWQFEGALTYINLPAITYTDNRTPLYNGESETEHFLLPTVFLVSPDMNNFRFGFSVTAPDGLAKRWTQPFPRSYAQEYSLKVFDINPTVSYQVGDMLSMAGGVRMLYASAKLSSYAVQPDTGIAANMAMDGDTVEWGWNLAASLRPMDNMNLSVTYRSNVDLDLDGDVNMGTNYPQPYVMNTGGSVSVPAPAVLSISMAYTIDKATVDLTWDRTYWSEYENITFTFDSPVTHPVLARVNQPIPKNWEDSDSYRIGLSYELNPTWTLMAGFAYDETAVPDATLGFELPDSDSFLYSIGARYRVNERMELGVAYLYDYKTSRSVSNDTINGTFTDASAHLLSFGLSYDF
ncbi:MAG: OmpP1/FadL family transporter [Proteobacteria bacterium]|nr:OmpP1/FadL family transporter [Pseudomonadota bacterium]MBU1420627.1 OmpP1/FadL family transporter [Pseudomonadota bacterium]MBU1455504.1 OmpP1/FadL family transporter [Pseudomonadota bacterium]